MKVAYIYCSSCDYEEFDALVAFSGTSDREIHWFCPKCGGEAFRVDKYALELDIEMDKIVSDLSIYGSGSMLGGKHVPFDQVFTSDASNSIENLWIDSHPLNSEDLDDDISINLHEDVLVLKELLADANSQVKHWKSNHSEMVRKHRVLSQRHDLPVDRLPAVRDYEQQLSEVNAYNERLVVSGLHLTNMVHHIANTFVVDAVADFKLAIFEGGHHE